MKKFIHSKILKPVLALLTIIFPSLANAQFSLESSIFRGVVYEAVDILKQVIPIMIAGAFIVFFWGVAKFVRDSGNAKEIENGRNYMIYGVFALFALLAFRGIIAFFAGEFGFGNSSVGGVFLPEN